MKIFQILLKTSLWFGVFLLACSNDDEAETKSLTFDFTVKVSEEDLVFDYKKYVTPSNQQVVYERLNIYLSNVQIVYDETDEVFSEPDSYHLIGFDADASTASFTIKDIPANYKVSAIRMAIGVDAEANTSIDHVGDLDPTNGMAWDWNTGYKFLSLEGRYFAENDPLGEEIKMHIGTDENYFEKVYPFESPVDLNQIETVQFVVDAMSPFGTIDLSEGTVFMNDERGNQVAENYKDALIVFK